LPHWVHFLRLSGTCGSGSTAESGSIWGMLPSLFVPVPDTGAVVMGWLRG
jgi:hypothetical protein